MPQINWERVWQQPLQFARVLGLTAQTSLALLWKVITGDGNSPSDLWNGVRVRFLAASNTVDYRFILATPSTAFSHVNTITGDGFTAYGTWRTKDYQTADAVILFLHGGGYMIGEPLQYRSTYERWQRKAAKSGLKLAVVSVQYPLSTVSSYPSQLDAAMAAYHHLISSLSIPAEKIFISGDSAGAHLAASLQLEVVKASGSSKNGGCILHSPWLDLTLAEASKSPYAAVDLLISPAFMRSTLVPAYTGNKYETADPRISPIYSQNLANLPPQLILWGAAEVLQCDAKAWVSKCKAAGIDVTTYTAPAGLHCCTMGGLAATRQTEQEADTVLVRWLMSQSSLAKQS